MAYAGVEPGESGICLELGFVIISDFCAMSEKSIASNQVRIFGLVLVIILLTFPFWGIKTPSGILAAPIAGNHDLLYFATDAPDNFIIYSPGLRANRQILPASERMSDMVVSSDGTKVWAASKAGFVDRFEIPVDRTAFGASTIRQKIAPVLGSIALSADERFIAVGYGNSEDYNSRNVKILPADTLNPLEELADFSVSGDIQDIVANPVKDLFYIVNSHTDRVRIYNAGRFRLEPDIIELGNSPGKFIVRPDGLRAYGSMNARKAVAVVDLETNKTTEYISLDFPPYAMCFSEDGRHLYVASRDSSSIVMIDTETDKINLAFDLPPRLPGLVESNFPEMIGISADENYMYVMPKRQELVVYDISPVREMGARGKPKMLQAEPLATTPFAMDVIRGHIIPGVPEK